MIYSDSELKEWWKKLSQLERDEIFDTMEENSHNPDFAISLRSHWLEKRWLSPKQLAAIRKWAP